jgi:hypothetical protein
MPAVRIRGRSILLFGFYEDESCEKLIQGSVILADGAYHISVHYSLVFQTSSIAITGSGATH